jgi:hypothetical protein
MTWVTALVLMVVALPALLALLARAIRVPRTDHRGVLAVIEFPQET